MTGAAQDVLALELKRKQTINTEQTSVRPSAAGRLQRWNAASINTEAKHKERLKVPGL